MISLPVQVKSCWSARTVGVIGVVLLTAAALAYKARNPTFTFAIASTIASSVPVFDTENASTSNVTYIVPSVDPSSSIVDAEIVSIDVDESRGRRIDDRQVLELYIRGKSAYLKQAHEILFPSLTLFWPGAATLLLLDGESSDDRKINTKVLPANMRVAYSEMQGFKDKDRMEFDMMNADSATSAEFVGFLDTDTFFTTWVTTRDIFEQPASPGAPCCRPVIVAAIGPAYNSWWEKVPAATEYILKEPANVWCMTYFPVVIRTAHLRALRKHVEKLHGVPFNEAWKRSREGRKGSQFDVMCNYIFKHHRDEYAWTLQAPKAGLNLAMTSRPFTGMAPDSAVAVLVDDLLTSQPSALLPRARVAVHAGWFQNMGKQMTPSQRVAAALPGFCHSLFFADRNQSTIPAYLDYCLKRGPLRNSNQTTHGVPIEPLLFDFENRAGSGRDWTWAPGCRRAQAAHYAAMASPAERPQFVAKVVKSVLPATLLPTKRGLKESQPDSQRALQASVTDCGALQSAETSVSGCAGPELDSRTSLQCSEI